MSAHASVSARTNQPSLDNKCILLAIFMLAAVSLYAQSATYFPVLTVGKLDNIVYVDGVTYTSVAAAMDALPSGGGTVIIPCSSTP